MLRLLFPIVMLMLLVLLALFVFRTITLGSPTAAWHSIMGTGQRWQQRFTSSQQQRSSSQQQTPYYQPQTPYYQPSQPAGQQPGTTEYGQGYANDYYRPAQQAQDYYRPAQQAQDADQPQARYPEQMPPMQH